MSLFYFAKDIIPYPKRYMDMEHLFKMEIEQPADEENPYI